MAQTLDEFILQERTRLEQFEAHWRRCHDVAPVAYPMAMEDDNEGIWTEALSTYSEHDTPPAPGELEPVPDGYVAPSPVTPVKARRPGR